MSSTGKKYSESYVKVEAERHDDGLYTIPDCIRFYADTHGDEESIVFADYEGGREAVTFSVLYERCVSVARSLIRLGVRKGELVAINVRSCPEWLYFVYGAMFAGAVPVSISFTYRDGSDLIALMDKLKTCCLIALDPGIDGGNWEIVKTLLDSYSADGKASSSKLPTLRYLIGHEEGDTKQMLGVKTIRELVNDTNTDIVLPDLTEDDMAFIVQTSGSTGVPKLAVHTHKSCLYIRQVNAGGFLDPTVIQYNDRPFIWIGGFPLSVFIGQKRVTVSGFCSQSRDRMAKVLEIVQRERCTLLTALPPMVHALIHSQDKLPADWPLKALLTGGQPLTKGISAAIGKVAPCISVAYGSTEFLIVSSEEAEDGANFQEYFCGKISKIPGLEVKIVDDSGDTVPINTRGEVYVRTPCIFKEYYNDPEKTAAVFTSDGWFKTDDIGMLTENGGLFIYGRKSHMIISGGMNVAPEILEHAMKSCPGVATVTIVPVPDDVYYQVLCACVILQTGSDLSEEDLRRFCEDIHNDSPRQFTVLPRYYLFLKNFPETSTGKTDRLGLRKLAAKTLTSS